MKKYLRKLRLKAKAVLLHQPYNSISNNIYCLKEFKCVASVAAILRNKVCALEKEMRLLMEEWLIGTRNLTSYRALRATRENTTDLHFLIFRWCSIICV